MKFVDFLFDEYLGVLLGGSNYIKLVLVFFFFYENRKQQETIGLFLVFVFYTFYGKLSFTNNLLYVINYVLTLYGFKYFGNVAQGTSVIYKDLKNIILVFILFFYVAYLFSMILRGPTLKGSGLSERIYYDGFIIAHMFSYFTIAIGMYLISINYKVLGLIATLFTFPVGARIGIILTGSTVFNYFYYRIHGFFLKVLIVGMVGVIVFFTFLHFNDMFLRIVSMFETVTLDIFDKDSQLAILFTSGRNLIWSLAFSDILNNFNFFEIMFGKGTFASVVFLEQTINNKIWLHNDFLDIMYNMGIFGLSVYIYSIVRFLKTTKMTFFVFIVIVAAFTNGFFSYDAICIVALFCLAKNNERLAYWNNSKSGFKFKYTQFI